MDDYSDLKAEWSPRAALVATPFEGTVLKVLYGQAFRAPNAYERVYDNGGLLGRVVGCRRGCGAAPRLSILGNEDLDPETITTAVNLTSMANPSRAPKTAARASPGRSISHINIKINVPQKTALRRSLPR